MAGSSGRSGQQELGLAAPQSLGALMALFSFSHMPIGNAPRRFSLLGQVLC